MIILDRISWYYHHSLNPMQFNLQLDAGEKVAVLGPSGSGKSTFLHLIAGFLPLRSGNLWLDGVQHNETPPGHRPVSILFQENNLFLHLTVEENIGLGLNSGLHLTSSQRKDLKYIAQQIGIDSILDQKPLKISGGQRQRTALARCLVRKKPILLLDEPFSALDPALRKEMIHLLNDICISRKITLLIVSHNLDDVLQLAPRTVLIVNGQIYYDGLTIKLMHGEIPEAVILGINPTSIIHSKY
ncbi:thiamine ABC transporter ATP-binding protein ThiQ [Candidatus Curculioniphilus buchneri]|uniref:thiamine ABC transporter ATP-binding protein ThiQ n=1 Tax=Candidatus Curculioniphilus buchneri TaxID=690594 RepID=UPI00376EDADD